MIHSRLLAWRDVRKAAAVKQLVHVVGSLDKVSVQQVEF